MDTYQQFVRANAFLLVIVPRRVAPQTQEKSQVYRGMPLADKDRDVTNEIKKWRWEYTQEDCEDC
jgi:hypothetical protein